jgi:hypothetical protein
MVHHPTTGGGLIGRVSCPSLRYYRGRRKDGDEASNELTARQGPTLE